jgi:type IV secretory pathway ATPase VirB11/archaellum biosynthesis ATPase
MSKRDVIVLRCPEQRCKECLDSSLSTCSRLAPFANDASSKAVITEPEKNLVHVGGLEGHLPTRPPWEGGDWETVFVDDYAQLLDSHLKLLGVYTIGPYLSLFFERAGESSILHRTHPLVRSPLEFGLLDRLSDELEKLTEDMPNVRMKLSDRLQRISECVSARIIQTLPEINEITRERIADIVAGGTSVLGPFLPILLDDGVEEVYVDRPGVPVYFDHQRFGRCTCDLVLNQDDVARLATLVRAESNLHLDRRNPSLKTNLRLHDIDLRLAISMPPLSPDGVHMEIRRAKMSPFTIMDLVLNGTLGLKAAATLVLAVGSRFNITITGGPGTGKTTLLNALDMSTPSMWRKIYIEDAIESRVLTNHRQVRIRVDPVDEISTRFDKTSEIVKSLHRSPDYLVLGEIQTAEHSRALFQAIAAGLRVMQTCHSDSAASLVARWTSGHGIEKTNVALLDLIVTMERPIPGKSYRRVSQIVEVRREIVDGFLTFSGLNTLYDWRDPESVRWVRDGAFMFHAHRIGLESHVPAFETVLTCLENEKTSPFPSPIPSLSDRLWGKGHPMRSLGV